MVDNRRVRRGGVLAVKHPPLLSGKNVEKEKKHQKQRCSVLQRVERKYVAHRRSQTIKNILFSILTSNIKTFRTQVCNGIHVYCGPQSAFAAYVLRARSHLLLNISMHSCSSDMNWFSLNSLFSSDLLLLFVISQYFCNDCKCFF